MPSDTNAGRRRRLLLTPLYITHFHQATFDLGWCPSEREAALLPQLLAGEEADLHVACSHARAPVLLEEIPEVSPRLWLIQNGPAPTAHARDQGSEAAQRWTL